MQTMSFVLGRGIGKNDNGRQFPVEVWQCCPENWCGESKEAGVDRLFQPPHDCRPFRLPLGLEPTWQEWVTLPNVWRSVQRQRGEASEEELEAMRESVVVSRRILSELIEEIR